MSDILQDDDFYAKPNLNVEGLGKEEILSKLLSIEEYYGKDLFIDNPISSDYVFIEGATSTVLEVGNSSYNILSSETADVQLAGGSHNIIQISGTLDFDQADGEAVIYLANTDNIDLNIQISNGKLNLVIDDPDVTGEITIEDGSVYFGGTRSNIEFSAFEESSTSVSILNLTDGNTLELSDNFIPVFQNIETAVGGDLSSGDGSDSPTPEGESGGSLGEDFENFDEFLESYFGSGSSELSQIGSPIIDFNAHEKYLSLTAESLDLDLSFDFEATDFFYQDLKLDLSKISSGDNDSIGGSLTNTSPTVSSQLEIDNLIEIDTYADLVWESALEIFEDT